MARLAGKIILVTGAASGLGAAMSTKFIAEGARVLLTDINAVGAAAKAAELGANAASFGHDVTDPAQWEAALAYAEETFGGLHILLNNAGVADGVTV